MENTVKRKNLTRENSSQQKNRMYIDRKIIPEEEIKENDKNRPKCRSKCRDGPRPCPWIACRYNLHVDVDMHGFIKYNQEDFDEEQESCALDVADKGCASLREVGDILNFSFERARQIEIEAMKKVEKILSNPFTVEADDSGI